MWRSSCNSATCWRLEICAIPPLGITLLGPKPENPEEKTEPDIIELVIGYGPFPHIWTFEVGRGFCHWAMKPPPATLMLGIWPTGPRTAPLRPQPWPAQPQPPKNPAPTPACACCRLPPLGVLGGTDGICWFPVRYKLSSYAPKVCGMNLCCCCCVVVLLTPYE